MQSDVLEYKQTDRPNIVITLLAGSFSFGAWALTEIADRLKEANRDTQNALTAGLGVAFIVGLLALVLFFSATSPVSVASTPSAPFQQPASERPAALVAIPAVEPSVKPTVEPLVDTEEEIKDLKSEIIETKKELREARKSVPEDVPALESDLHDLEIELKELQQKKSTSQKGH
jgi:septal ring factor EnvC (AmiA/AmiB activator)